MFQRHPIGMLSLAFQVPHLLPMQRNWMLNPGSCQRTRFQRVHLPQRRRTQVPIVEGGESAFEGSDLGRPGVVGAAIHNDLTLIDSSDDDVPFTVPRSAEAPTRP